MIRSYSFQNPCAFPMACATFETTAQKTLGKLACRDIWWSSFHWNASLTNGFRHLKKLETQHYSRSNRVSLFFVGIPTRDTSLWRFAGETRASNVTCIPMQRARRDLNASDAF